ncbi:MAG: hypothetical protein R6V41_10860 [Desulfobacteraceae bacterium]
MTGSELDILVAKIAERIAVQPRWLKLKQAAVYASIGKGELLDLVRRGGLMGFRIWKRERSPGLLIKKE